MTPLARQHRLSDWLELHELNPAICKSLLDAMSELAGTSAQPVNPADSGGSTIDLETAWRTIVEAMRAFFPAQAGIIDLTFGNTLRMLVPRVQGSRKAVTIDNGPNAFPTIVYSFLGGPADLLVVAHEFAHALQIRASKGRFASPVIREICAFMGEYAVVAHFALLDTNQHLRLSQVWDADNQKYFGTGRRRLVSAVSQPELAYSYSWNYPIARYLAIELQKRLTLDQIWALFEGRMTVTGLLPELDLAIT